MNEHFPHRPPFSFHSLPCLISFLYVQIEDRRSSVNKQACFTLTALAAALGTRFQDHAAYFLPSLFKVLPITVLVGSRVALPGYAEFLASDKGSDPSPFAFCLRSWPSLPTSAASPSSACARLIALCQS